MPIFIFHDKARLELHFFSFGKADPDTIQKLKTYGVFHDMHKLIAFDAAHEINYLGIDVLIDLKGHGQGSLIGMFGLRPAPIQVQMLVYPSSIGAKGFYALVDKVVAPN